jgi:hypothetical protein
MSVVNQVANNYHGHRVQREIGFNCFAIASFRKHKQEASQELKHVFYDETFAQNNFVHHCLRATSKEDVNVLTQ